MKKILAIMLAIVLCMSVLTGCGSNTGNTDVIGSSDAVEENTESSVEDASVGTETDMADSENATASEEESEITEEKVMFSADEVMTHIDTLIAQYTYNDSEHIKALVIAANLDYISEADLDTILTTYGYTMEDLGVLYDECILDNGTSNKISLEYSQGNIEILKPEEKYENRVTLESIMLCDFDKEISLWFDSLLIDDSNGNAPYERRSELKERIENCNDELSYAEMVIYSYSWGIYMRNLSYTDYLDNPYTYYINSNL